MKNRKFGTPLKRSAIKLMMLGSGELGKEVVIEAMRFGIEVIACDRYADAPAMLVANSAYVFDMRDGGALRHVVETVKPDFIVPEIEAIATDTLVEPMIPPARHGGPEGAAATAPRNRCGLPPAPHATAHGRCPLRACHRVP